VTRAIAVRTLLSSEKDRSFAADELEERLAGAELPLRDRRFVTQLVYGTLRRRLTLDWVLKPVMKARFDRLDPVVRANLRIAAFQALYLEKVPDHAVVNEAVSLTREEVGRKAAGFVNGVLRTFLRGIEERNLKSGDLPEGRALRVARDRWVLFRDTILPTAVRDLPRAMSVQHSHPAWLLMRWLKRWSPEEVARICDADNDPPCVVLRANSLRGGRAALMASLAAQEVPAREGNLPESVILGRSGPVTGLDAFRDGLCQVQDEAAMEAVHLLAPEAGSRALDACAAPGGKATHMAEKMGDKGLVVAVDLDPARTAMIRQNATRLGLRSVRAVTADLRALPFARETRETFRSVLLDAPCSNTAVLARRVEARWRIGEKDLMALPLLQLSLLHSAARFVAPGGAIVYSTCSLEPEENEQVVAAFLADATPFKLATEKILLPREGGLGGGYAARLERGA